MSETFDLIVIGGGPTGTSAAGGACFLGKHAALVELAGMLGGAGTNTGTIPSERVSVDGHSFPLAADFTVPIAVMLAQNDPKKLELARLLRPEKYAETARIARLQPYDPNKTVVLVIHGLMDSQATWTPMLNALRGDEQIRKNYQFWFYSYPSGYPYQHSAAILRRAFHSSP